MNRQSVIDQFKGIRMWVRGSERAPHKPLLLLMALGRISRGESGSIEFRDVNKELTDLLREFGPSRKSYHPEYPFWRLQNDGIWFVSDSENLERRKGKEDAKKTELIKHNPTGGIKPEIMELLAADHSLVSEIAGMILENNFTHTLHEDILASVGLSLDFTLVKKSQRDPAFRGKILRAYEYRCAVCGFDLQLGPSNLALEAAHIMWHQAGGPDIEPNGLALCSLHHKMLDRGAFTVVPGNQLLVSQDVHGSQGMEEHLLQHHGKEIRKPQSPEFMAHPKYLEWHGKEVFKGPERSVNGQITS